MRITPRIVTAVLALSVALWAVPQSTHTQKAKKRKSAATSTTRKAKPAPKSATQKKAAAKAPTAKAAPGGTIYARAIVPARRPARRAYYSQWDTPTYADSTWGDTIDGEDLTVRRAAVQALGPYNGTVVVADPNTGRLLSMVNQRLALTGSFQPCSTIKLVASLAALSEGLIERNTMLRLSRAVSMNLTTALAKSNNPYFAMLGNKLGFERVSHYARMFGLGERAGLNIQGESPGVFPAGQPKGLNVGMMTSFGEGIGLTPLQLAALVSAVANGGTLYYLQYPQRPGEIDSLVPRVKRYLDIQQWIPEIKPGMMGAVDFGTARRAGYDPNEPIMGKTGTCSDQRAHLGWFGSFNEVGRNKLVVVVLLTGGKPVNGPVAASVAGHVYRQLSEQQYFAMDHTGAPLTLYSTQNCCAQ